MANTREILWYGRGGQGAFSASKLLGASYALSGEKRYALAFPSFGPERRGAPVRAFTKISDGPVTDRSAVTHPDYVICLDETLLSDLGSTSIKEGGAFIVVNDDVRSVATEILGRDIVNTALLSLLALQLGDVSLGDLERGIYETMPAAIQKKNIALVTHVFEHAQDLSSAVHVAKAPEPRKPRPHELNEIIGGAEYMDITTARFDGPQQAYRPGESTGGTN